MQEQDVDEAIESLVDFVQSDDFNTDRLEKYEHAVLEATLRERCPLYFAFVNNRVEKEDADAL